MVNANAIISLLPLTLSARRFENTAVRIKPYGLLMPDFLVCEVNHVSANNRVYWLFSNLLFFFRHALFWRMCRQIQAFWTFFGVVWSRDSLVLAERKKSISNRCKQVLTNVLPMTAANSSSATSLNEAKCFFKDVDFAE